MDKTFEEFLKDLRGQVDKFGSDYVEGMRTQPSVFPATLSEADWYEQFTSFVGFGE